MFDEASKGLFINDVITFVGYRAPPPHMSSFGRAPPSPSSDDVIYEQPLSADSDQSSQICYLV